MERICAPEGGCKKEIIVDVQFLHVELGNDRGLKKTHLHPKREGRIFPTQHRIFNAIDSPSEFVHLSLLDIPQEGWHAIIYRGNTRKQSTFDACG